MYIIAILGSLAISAKWLEDQEVGIGLFCLFKTTCSTKADTREKDISKSVCIDNSFIT